jgi:hypothetical protein
MVDVSEIVLGIAKCQVSTVGILCEGGTISVVKPLGAIGIPFGPLGWAARIAAGLETGGGPCASVNTL